MSETVWKKGDKILRIHPDQDAESPREWSNLGIMLCSHHNYNLGDVQCTSQEQYDAALEEAVVHLPIYLYEHSGLALSTDGFPLTDPQGWDSGQVGMIYTIKSKIREIYGDKTPTRETITRILKTEVKVYGQYLNGEVLGYEIYKVKKGSTCEADWEFIDACGGYYSMEEILEQTGESGWEETVQ